MAPTQPPQERLESLKHWLGLPSEAERAGGSEAERAGGAGRVGALRRLKSEKQLVRPQSAAPGRSEKRLARCESTDVATMPGAFGERLRAEANRLRAETEALCRDRDATKLDRDALRGEVRRLHEEAAQLHNESAELRQENARTAMLRDEAAQLRAENADLRAEAAALRAEGASLRHENAELRGEGAALRRSHELLQCERSALSCSTALPNGSTLSCSTALPNGEEVAPKEQQMAFSKVGMSGGAYCWPEEQQLRYKLRRTGMGEDSQDEMELGDELEMDRCRIQAGDPIGPYVEDHMGPSAGQWCSSWHEPAMLCCPSPSRRAQRMRPISAASYAGSRSTMSGLLDATLKQPPVPKLFIQFQGEEVGDQYEESDSESDDDEDDDDGLQSLRQGSGLLQKADLLSCNPRQMSGVVAEKRGNNETAPRDVAEPCGSSARPPRAKGSHSLEVGPSGPMHCHSLGGPRTPSMFCGIQKEDQE